MIRLLKQCPVNPHQILNQKLHSFCSSITDCFTDGDIEAQKGPLLVQSYTEHLQPVGAGVQWLPLTPLLMTATPPGPREPVADRSIGEPLSRDVHPCLSSSPLLSLPLGRDFVETDLTSAGEMVSGRVLCRWLEGWAWLSTTSLQETLTIHLGG